MMTPEPSPLWCGWMLCCPSPKNWRNIGLSSNPGGSCWRLPRIETRFAFVSVVIFTTLGETRFTTEEKLAFSSAPRLTTCVSRFTSTAGLLLVLPDCAPAANAPARASAPEAQRAFRRLEWRRDVFMVEELWPEDAIPTCPQAFWRITEM